MKMLFDPWIYNKGWSQFTYKLSSLDQLLHNMVGYELTVAYNLPKEEKANISQRATSFRSLAK